MQLVTAVDIEGTDSALHSHFTHTPLTRTGDRYDNTVLISRSYAMPARPNKVHLVRHSALNVALDLGSWSGCKMRRKGETAAAVF
jgi:hypothetical protein